MTDDQGGGDGMPDDNPDTHHDPAVDGAPDAALASLLAADGTVPHQPQPQPVPDRGEPAEGAAPGGLTTTDDGRGFIWDPTPREADIDTTGSLGQHIQVTGADGQTYVAEYARDENGEPRVRYAVGVIETKQPYEQRFTRGMLDTAEQQADRRYASLFPPLDPDDPSSQLGAADAPDDDPVHGVGVESWWTAYMTVDEVDAARAGDPTRTLTYQTRFEPR